MEKIKITTLFFLFSLGCAVPENPGHPPDAPVDAGSADVQLLEFLRFDRCAIDECRFVSSADGMLEIAQDSLHEAVLVREAPTNTVQILKRAQRFQIKGNTIYYLRPVIEFPQKLIDAWLRDYLGAAAVSVATFSSARFVVTHCGDYCGLLPSPDPYPYFVLPKELPPSGFYGAVIDSTGFTTLDVSYVLDDLGSLDPCVTELYREGLIQAIDAQPGPSGHVKFAIPSDGYWLFLKVLCPRESGHLALMLF